MGPKDSASAHHGGADETDPGQGRRSSASLPQPPDVAPQLHRRHYGQTCPVCRRSPCSVIERRAGAITVLDLMCPSEHLWQTKFLRDRGAALRRRPLVVDGPRPAVAWVTSLPREWLTRAERFVLLVLACDSSDGLSVAPGYENLAAWTGMQLSTVRDTVADLCKPTAKRPALLCALLRRENTSGGRENKAWAFRVGG